MMGLAEKIKAKNTLEQGPKYLDADGQLVATFHKGAFGGLTSDFEILRGDLARVLFDATKADVEYRFGVFITDLRLDEPVILTIFSDGTTEAFDSVICAEGFSSSTRNMMLADQVG